MRSCPPTRTLEPRRIDPRRRRRAADHGGGETDDEPPSTAVTIPPPSSASSGHATAASHRRAPARRIRFGIDTSQREGGTMGPMLATADQVDGWLDAPRAPWDEHLTPLEILRAQRLGVPRQDRRGLRRPALHLRRVRGAGEPAGVGAPGGRPGSRASASPCSARTSRRCWRPTSRCPSPGASSSRSTSGWRRTTSPGSSSTAGASFLLVDTEFCPPRRAGAGPPARPAADRQRRRHGTGAHPARADLRGVPGRRAAGSAGLAARGRDRPDRHQLHQRHHGPAEGRDVHPPRGLPQRPRRVAPLTHQQRFGLPLDPADVPLQRVVPDLGRDRRRRAPTSACARSTPRWSGR